MANRTKQAAYEEDAVPSGDLPGKWIESRIAIDLANPGPVPLALNEIAGTWTISANDVAAGKEAETTFKVNPK